MPLPLDTELIERKWQARRDSNPQPPDLESDALPLELLACILNVGKISSINYYVSLILKDSQKLLFADFFWRSNTAKTNTIRAHLFCFPVWCMLTTKSAVFIELQLIWRCALIFCRCIISSFAFSAC